MPQELEAGDGPGARSLAGIAEPSRRWAGRSCRSPRLHRGGARDRRARPVLGHQRDERAQPRAVRTRRRRPDRGRRARERRPSRATPRLPRAPSTWGALFLGLYVVAHVVVRRTAPYADGALLPLTAVLTAFGLATIYRLDPDDGGRQALWVAVGVAVLAGALIWLRHDYRVLESYRYVFGVTAVALLLLPSIPGLGERVNGVRLWVDIGPLQFQPGELAKIFLIVFLAGYLREKREVLAQGRLKEFGPLFVIWGAAMLVIVQTNDLGQRAPQLRNLPRDVVRRNGTRALRRGRARALRGRCGRSLQRAPARSGSRHDLAPAMDGRARLLRAERGARAPSGLRLVPARQEPVLDRQRRLRRNGAR